MNLLDIQQTDEHFMESLLTLLMEKPIHRISIRELCQKTGYNRSTFYYYFTDIYDLERATQTRLIDTILSQIRLHPILTDRDFVHSLTHVYDTYGPLILLLSQNSDFYQAYQAALQPFLFQFLQEEQVADAEKLTLTYDFLMGGILSLLDRHYRTESHLSTQELAHFIQEQIAVFLQGSSFRTTH